MVIANQYLFKFRRLSEVVMAISFEKSLGVLPDTLAYRSQRAEVLASNIANIDTPGFQAKDLSFDHILKQQEKLQLQQSNSRHITLPDNELEQAITEREANQISTDGNSVDLSIEQADFMRNSMEFQTSFTFLNMQLAGLRQAITGM